MAPDTCGEIVTFGALHSGLAAGSGSSPTTSSTAPARRPSRSASSRASSSTRAPRDTLISQARPGSAARIARLDDPARGRRQGQGQDQEVGLGRHLGEGVHAGDALRDGAVRVARPGNPERRIVALVRTGLDGDDPQAQRGQLARHLPPDRSVAHDHRGPPAYDPRGLPVLVRRPAMGGLVRGPRPDRLVDAQDGPADVFADRDGEDAARVGHRDARAAREDRPPGDRRRPSGSGASAGGGPGPGPPERATRRSPRGQGR